jgi:hypothetical protein
MLYPSQDLVGHKGVGFHVKDDSLPINQFSKPCKPMSYISWKTLCTGWFWDLDLVWVLSKEKELLLHHLGIIDQAFSTISKKEGEEKMKDGGNHKT